MPAFSGANWIELQGNLARNALNGFVGGELDLTVRGGISSSTRGFSCRPRVDLFNVFNHPNFGPPVDFDLATVRAGDADARLIAWSGRSSSATTIYLLNGAASDVLDATCATWAGSCSTNSCLARSRVWSRLRMHPRPAGNPHHSGP